jgi:hypothetical protein
MNRRSILTKTGKGLMEATGKTSALSRDLRNILKEIDGKVSVSELLRTFSKMTEPELLEALKSMEREGYLREFVGKQEEAPRPSIPRAPTAPSSADAGEDLDFTAFTPAKPSAKTSEDARLQTQAQDIARQAQATRAREEAAAKARAEAAARARAEAEHKARLSARAGLSGSADSKADTQAEALDQARREAEERQRREAEEKARREAVARAVIEAEQTAKREAEERIRREVEERTRRENEERGRREAEARVSREAEDKVRREAEERARKEVEERMRREEVERRVREEREQAERRARIEAEARAKVEADMRARRESEERARREEEERPGREEELRRRAEEEARGRGETEEREALERSLREQEENARREVEYREREEEQRKQEEERARRESEEEEARRAGEEDKRAEEEEEKRAREEEKARAKAEKKARKAVRAKERLGEEARDLNEASLSAREIWAKRRPGNLAKQFAVMLLLTLIVAVAALPFVPLESGPYEKAAQAWLGVPVKIGTVNLTLLPIPQLKFEKVVIGKEHPMRAAVIKAAPVLTSLLEDAISLKSLELENVTFPREFLPALLQDKGGRRSLGVQRVSAKGWKLDIPELNLPALEVSASLSSDGALQSVAFSNAERRLSVKLQPQGGRAGIEISADSFPLPTGADLALSEFFAKGTVTRGELALSEAEARAFGGRVLGNARIRWSSGWSMEGEFVVRQMEAGKIAAPLLAGGTLEGKGVYSMKGLLPERMILNAQLEGNFTIQKGSITNVDMTRLLQGSGSGGGTTLFSEMSGGVSADANRLLVRQIRMAAGLLNGTGQVEMDPQKNLSGRMQIELRAQSVQARATLTVTGTLQNPQFRRSN